MEPNITRAWSAKPLSHLDKVGVEDASVLNHKVAKIGGRRGGESVDEDADAGEDVRLPVDNAGGRRGVGVKLIH